MVTPDPCRSATAGEDYTAAAGTLTSEEMVSSCASFALAMVASGLRTEGRRIVVTDVQALRRRAGMST